MRPLHRFLLALALFGLLFWLEPAPGYMDADYYAVNGLLTAGEGALGQEPFLWHYLDDPQGIPHPAFSYWMPLPAWLGALGAFVFPALGERAVRLPFVLMSAVVPLLTATLAYTFTRHREDAALAAWLALFSGFYLPFLPTSDAFAPLMLIGGAFFLLLSAPRSPGTGFSLSWRALLSGVLLGLLYLTRAEGLVWLLVGGVALWFVSREVGGQLLKVYAAFALGFLLTAGPWMLRNRLVFGTPLSPVGVRALWWTTYDELYTYPAAALSWQHWLSSGVGEIVRVRLWALGQNLQTMLAVQGSIFLLPLMLAGGWRLRRQPVVQTGALAWGGLLLIMSFVFPFAGARGGFFHAGAALQVLLWALVPVGLRAFIDLGVRYRHWQPARAGAFFRWGLVMLAALLSGLLLVSRIRAGQWGRSEAHYQQVDTVLQIQGATPDEIVMVNNPPGYVLATGRPAIVIPYGDLNTLLAVARRYDARYLVLESNYRGGPLDALYASPPAWLHLLETLDDTLIFAIEPVP